MTTREQLVEKCKTLVDAAVSAGIHEGVFFSVERAALLKAIDELSASLPSQGVPGWKLVPQAEPQRWHELKTDTEVFDAVASSAKAFEIRLNDRDFRVGDGLRLRRTSSTGKQMAAGAPLVYTGEEVTRVVSHVFRGPQYGLDEGWVILSFALAASPEAPAPQPRTAVDAAIAGAAPPSPPSASPDVQELVESVGALLEAQDALDNREISGPNAEDYFTLLRRRNSARDGMDAALSKYGSKQ